MANELFNQYGPSNQINQIRESLRTQITQLKSTGIIDPNQKIQEMLNSGQTNQQLYNRAALITQQLQQLLGNSYNI